MKNVVITGSTRGIGLAMAREFLEKGCCVTLSGRGGQLPEPVTQEFRNYSGRYLYVPCDVRIRNDHELLWNRSRERWGRVDIWVNNAGRNAPHSFVWETDECFTADVVATNITGMVFGSQVASAGMLLQKHGAIYNMEGLGSNDMIQPKTVLYGTTKRALTYFTRGLAKELKGTGVLACRLSPGMMLTDFIMKTPDGTAAAIETDERFRTIFNILGDRPETVAKYLVRRMLANRHNDVRIAWLTGSKAAVRFLCAPFRKGRLL